MPLIDFRSDLTTLRYGGDKPGGGWSGQPYIQSPNPNNPPTLTAQSQELFDNFYRANNTTSDFPIRGGVVDFRNVYPKTPAGQIDRARIEAFLRGPKGAIFKFKQQGLQLANPNIQVPSILNQLTVNAADPLGALGLALGSQVIKTTRIFSPDATSIRLQTEVQGTGVHLQRHGLFPNIANPYQQTYEYFVSKNNTALSNRLAILATLKIKSRLITRNTGTYDQNQANNPVTLQFATDYGVSPLNHQILNYAGGPGSLYGIGFTVINRSTDTTQAADKAASLYNALTLTYAQLAEQNTVNGQKRDTPKIQDFRTQLPAGTAPTSNYNPTGKEWYNPARRGDPGRPTKRRVSYQTPTGLHDRLSAQTVFQYDPTKRAPWEINSVESQDIIKFVFECLSNDNSASATAIIFRAFLSNFTDNHQAELNSFKYLGRGETFRTYQGFDRSIGFSFKVAAQSRVELQPLYKKLNHLISQIYPDYSEDSKLMRGSVVKLTIGDYLYRVPGFLESINVSVADNYAWEINLENSDDVNQVPQILDVQCSFKPLHGFLPRRETFIDNSVPLIGKFDGKKGWLSTGIPPADSDNTQADITAGMSGMRAQMPGLSRTLAQQITPPRPQINTPVKSLDAEETLSQKQAFYRTRFKGDLTDPDAQKLQRGEVTEDQLLKQYYPGIF